jgi:hypothetical protein
MTDTITSQNIDLSSWEIINEPILSEWFVFDIYISKTNHSEGIGSLMISLLLSQVYCVWQVVKTQQSFQITLYFADSV